MTTREQELEAIVRKLVPAWGDISWCALIWNDHNFTEDEFRKRAASAAKHLGLERSGRYKIGTYGGTHIPAIDEANEFFEHVEKVLGGKP
jgi:hypothetical protein